MLEDFHRQANITEPLWSSKIIWRSSKSCQFTLKVLMIISESRNMLILTKACKLNILKINQFSISWDKGMSNLWLTGSIRSTWKFPTTKLPNKLPLWSIVHIFQSENFGNCHTWDIDIDIYFPYLLYITHRTWYF